jgi:hypothetical protein
MALRVNISDNWEDKRCDPYVIPIAGLFKPFEDPRTASEFSTDNWKFCQKEYIQNALRTATRGVDNLVSSTSASAGMIQDIVGVSADIFFDVWKFCHSMYSGFMDKMKTATMLFRNFMIKMHTLIQRVDAAVTSIVFALISLLIGIMDSIKFMVVVAVIIMAILIILQIILFFILMPISGLIATAMATMNIIIITLAATVVTAVSDSFISSGACFASGTRVSLSVPVSDPDSVDGSNKTNKTKTKTMSKSIETIQLGQELQGGGRVTAIHQFIIPGGITNMCMLNGIRVTGDHLVVYKNALIPVSEHPDCVHIHSVCSEPVWCLTTTTRRIPVLGHGPEITWFADWEEIDDDDTDGRQQWYREVWKSLNRFVPMSISDSKLDVESGVDPNCLIECRKLFWFGIEYIVYKPIKDVRIGDVVCDSFSLSGQTTVIGKVSLEGDMSADVTQIGQGLYVSPGTWGFRDGLWTLMNSPTCDKHVSRWEHLYTASGSFTIKGGLTIRDASDVGLANLERLVKKVVMK